MKKQNKQRDPISSVALNFESDERRQINSNTKKKSLNKSKKPNLSSPTKHLISHMTNHSSPDMHKIWQDPAQFLKIQVNSMGVEEAGAQIELHNQNSNDKSQATMTLTQSQNQQNNQQIPYQQQLDPTFQCAFSIQKQTSNKFISLNKFMEGESLKNLIERQRRSLSEGMSTKEEDTEEREEVEEEQVDVDNFQDAMSQCNQEESKQDFKKKGKGTTNLIGQIFNPLLQSDESNNSSKNAFSEPHQDRYQVLRVVSNFIEQNSGEKLLKEDKFIQTETQEFTKLQVKSKIQEEDFDLYIDNFGEEKKKIHPNAHFIKKASLLMIQGQHQKAVDFIQKQLNHSQNSHLLQFKDNSTDQQNMNKNQNIQVKFDCSDLKFLLAACHMKLRNFHRAVTILNDLKRNQICRNVKIKALKMRMKAHRKMQKYEESLTDARCVWAMMSQEQLIQNDHIKQDIRELKVSQIKVFQSLIDVQVLCEYQEQRNINVFVKALKCILQFLNKNKKVILIVLAAVLTFLIKGRLLKYMKNFRDIISLIHIPL